MDAKGSDLQTRAEQGPLRGGRGSALPPGPQYLPQTEKTQRFSSGYLPFPPLKLPSLHAVQMCWYYPAGFA